LQPHLSVPPLLLTGSCVIMPPIVRNRRPSLLSAALLCSSAAAAALALSARLLGSDSGAFVTLSRRGILSAVPAALAGAGAAQWQPKSAQAAGQPKSRFAGRWSDSDAPGCKREIIVAFDGLSARVKGSDRDPNSMGNLDLSQIAKGAGKGPSRQCISGAAVVQWSAKASMASADATDMTVDLSRFGASAETVVKWQDGELVFPDGSKWTRISR